MRFEHEGLTLWYGTEDTSAPEGDVPAHGALTITIGVQPVDASNSVEVRYRVNQEPVQTVTGTWLRNDVTGKTQYFQARLPALRVGDTVEYMAICRCAGRQVPSPEQAQRLESSFR